MRCRNSRHIFLTQALSLAILFSCQVSLGERTVSYGYGKAVGGMGGAANGAVVGAQAGTGSMQNYGYGGGRSEGRSEVRSEVRSEGRSEGRFEGNMQNPDSAPPEVSAKSYASSESGSGTGYSQAQASVHTNPMPKQEGGIFNKVKDMFKEGKDMIKDVVAPKDDGTKSKFDGNGPFPQGSGAPINLQNNNTFASSSASASASSSSSSSSSSLSSPSSSSSSSSAAVAVQSNLQGQAQAQGYASQQNNQTPKPEGGLLSKVTEKVSEIAHKGEKVIKDVVDTAKERFEERKEGALSRFYKASDTVKEGVQRIENKVQEVGQKIFSGDDKPKREFGATKDMIAEASAKANISPENKPSQDNSPKEVVAEAKAKATIPSEEMDKSKGTHTDEKSVAVSVFDKAHEVVKSQAESVLKPIDQMLGVEKSPIVNAYDNSHEMLRKPLGMLAKPVESIMSGAFKTTDESKKDKMMTMSKEERREAKMREEKAMREGGSILGNIYDKTMDLYSLKPLEIVLKPIDHMTGRDKDGKKNPLLKRLKEFYGLLRRPMDTFAKPVEKILRKMGGEKQMYQVSVRFQNEDDNNDPKLVTRLADGALSMVDRMFTKPIEVFVKPVDKMLGGAMGDNVKPIIEAVHSLNSAQKVGVELFTRPIDRIIKEISRLGDRSGKAAQSKEEASRLVLVLDRVHNAYQKPFEIVLRPVSRALGLSKEGQKEPLLKAWDLVHRVIMTPLQIISKPIEDALFGERERKQNGGVEASASAASSTSGGGAQASASANVKVGKKRPNIFAEDHKKNIFTEGIKKVEKIATQPLVAVTAPIREMITGEDGKTKSEAGAQAVAKVGDGQVQASAQASSQGGQGNKPDKIMKTLDNIENVLLKPLEVVTQPISDLLTQDSKRPQGGQDKSQVKVQVQAQSQSQGQGRNQAQGQESQSQSQPQAQSQVQIQGQSSGQGAVQIQSQAQSQVQN